MELQMPNCVIGYEAAALTAAIQAINLPANNNGYQSNWTAACAVAALNEGR